MQVSRIIVFEHKNIDHLAIGLTSGNCILKLADKLMKDDYVALIHSENSSGDQIYKRFIPPTQKQGNNSTGNYGDSLDEEDNDKVTFIGYFS